MKKIISALLSAVLLLSLLTLVGCTKKGTVTAAPAAEALPTLAPAPAAEPAQEPVQETAPAAEPTQETAPEADPVVEETPAPKTEPVGPINPLTGESIEEDISARRPFAVMLNNHQNALPQCSISSADIIYELPEEGITRMLALFADYPDCDRLGSVRSSRPYHVDVALSYDAIYVHWGRSDRAAGFMYNIGIDHIELNEGLGRYAYRDYTHPRDGSVEHSGFLEVDQLKALIAENNWRTEHEGEHGYGFTFSEDPALTGGDAQNVRVYFSSKISNFLYSAENGGYNMCEYGEDYKDGDTGIIPTFRNVVVLRANMVDETGLADITLTNTKGVGTIYCDGKQQDFSWERGDYNDNFHYYKQDGTPLEFGVGKTYICVVSNTDKVELF